jgi:hypothetical protein
MASSLNFNYDDPVKQKAMTIRAYTSDQTLDHLRQRVVMLTATLSRMNSTLMQPYPPTW